MNSERWTVPPALARRMRNAARDLRKVQTRSEVILWEALRGGALDGRKFRRQQPIGPFVVDFFCAAERLVVEVDGGVHSTRERHDQQRQAALETLGLRLIRIPAERVETNLALVLADIRSAFLPSPLVGEGPGVRG